MGQPFHIDVSTGPSPGLVKMASRGFCSPSARPSGMDSTGHKDNALKALRVLLVEDQLGDATLVMISLRDGATARFAVTHVTTLAAAKAHLTEHSVDVVLLDLSLPDSSGLDTVTKVLAVAQDMPVVVMTGLDDPSLASRALEVGAQDYLVKSDDPGRTVERAILYAVTRMAAQIERRQFLEKLEEEQRRVQQEITIARTMQFDLLPRPDRINAALQANGLALEAYFEPCSGIGGDLWGCADLGDGRLSIISFDFSGHGIAAALNVFRLHALIGEHKEYLPNPGTLLTLLGASLRKLLGRGQFATMFAAVIDTANQEIIWAGAGAPPPLLFRGGEGEFLDTRGMPLGLSSRASYENRRADFPRGSSLLIYSDALIEAENSDGNMLGSEGLAELTRRHYSPGSGLRMGDMLDEFYNWARPPIEDDLTVIQAVWG